MSAILFQLELNYAALQATKSLSMPGANNLPSPRFWFPPPAALPLKSSIPSSVFSPLTFRNPVLEQSAMPTRYPMVTHIPNPFTFNATAINPMLTRHNFASFPGHFTLPPQTPPVCAVNPFAKDHHPRNEVTETMYISNYF